EDGVFSWYDAPGALTASGEIFDSNAMTAAHKTLPFNTVVQASCNGRSVTVRINDRGPFVAGRILDVTPAAGRELAEDGVFSWYDAPAGAITASGEPFDPNAMTAAHKTLPFGTVVQASCNGRSISVRINDRGPFSAGRILDVTPAGGRELGIIDSGLCQGHI
ncbi:unnamed protein product, partial [Oppiella nova]